MTKILNTDLLTWNKIIINNLISFSFLFHRFGLFEAMSAIEMMDVKMDAGMMCNQIKREVRTLEQSVEVIEIFISPS
jgi:hypothetical protein